MLQGIDPQREVGRAKLGGELLLTFVFVVSIIVENDMKMAC